MELSASDIAALVKGKLSGDGKTIVRGAAGLDEAGANDISFLRDIKKPRLLTASKAGVVLIPKGFAMNGRTLIEVDNPIAAFSTVLKKLSGEKSPPRAGIHPLASIAPSARVGKNVFVGPFCVVEDGAEIADDVSLLAQVYVGARTKIGQGTLIYPQVVLREEISIGRHCIIHPVT
jgi:UDP-3-O-[3-hydroxymyristoyl] glucosamine N-acyltransferase